MRTAAVQRFALIVVVVCTPAWSYADELAVTAFDRQGTTHQLPGAMPVLVDADDRSLQFMCRELGCVLLKEKGSQFVIGVPLAAIVTCELAGDRCVLLTEDGARFSGQLLTSLRAGDDIMLPEQLAGFNVSASLQSPALPGWLRTGCSAHVEDLGGAEWRLNDMMLLDQFLAAGKSTTDPIRQLGFHDRGMTFYVPIDRIASWQTNPDSGTSVIEFERGQSRRGEVLTREVLFLDAARGSRLGPPGRFDYLVGQSGRAFYLLPLAALKSYRATASPPLSTPAGRWIHLVEQDAGDVTNIVAPRVEIRPEDHEDALLASVGGLILKTGELGRVGVPLSAIRRIDPADKGRVVVETRSGRVFAGRLACSIRGVAGGAKVIVEPGAFTVRQAMFLGDWSTSDAGDSIKPTMLDISVRLRGGERRRLRQAFVLDRGGLGEMTRMHSTVHFPLRIDQVCHLVDLRHVHSIRRLEDDRWELKPRHHEALVGKPGFLRPTVERVRGAADGLDSLVGNEGGVLDFVSLDFVEAANIELVPGARPPEVKDEPESRAEFAMTAGQKLAGTDIRFTAPSRPPVAALVAGSAPVLYAQMGDVTRLVHLRSVNRITRNDNASPTFRVLGKLPEFEVSLLGSVSGTLPWGEFEISPDDLAEVRFELIPLGGEFANPRTTSRKLQIVTHTGRQISWPRAWISDTFLRHGSLAFRFVSACRLADETGVKDTEFADLASIRFEDVPGRYGGTAAMVKLAGEANERRVDVKLRGLELDGQFEDGPVTHDCVIGWRGNDCLEVISLQRVKSIQFSP